MFASGFQEIMKKINFEGEKKFLRKNWVSLLQSRKKKKSLRVFRGCSSC